jgi:hypothetical protein
MVERGIHVLVCVVVVALGMVAGDPLSEEGLALLAMRSGWADPQSHLETWKLNGTATPCLWSGIACNNVSSVVGLYLGTMNLSGTLSADLGRLKSIVNLSLELNNFTGQVPAEVTTLAKLQFVNISNNNFNGPFPANFSQLQSLQVSHQYHMSITSVSCRYRSKSGM